MMGKTNGRYKKEYEPQAIEGIKSRLAIRSKLLKQKKQKQQTKKLKKK